MRKSLFLSIILCFFCVAHANAEDSFTDVSVFGWDFKNGWFDQPENAGKFTAPKEIYDNDLNTYYTVRANRIATVKFVEPIESGFFGFYLNKQNSIGNVLFYYKNQLVDKYVINSNFNVGYHAIKVQQPVDKIQFYTEDPIMYRKFVEFDLFTSNDLSLIKSLKADADFQTIKIEWENPVESISSRIYLNNVLIDSVSKDKNSYVIKNLNADTVYTVGVSAVFNYGESKISDLTVKTKTVPPLPDGFVSVNTKTTSADILFYVNKLPVTAEKIYLYKNKDDTKPYSSITVSSTAKNVKSTIYNLNDETEYEYYVAAAYSANNLTDKVKINFKTQSLSKEIRNLKLKKVDFNKVELVWLAPEKKENYEIARIYRRKASLLNFDEFELIGESTSTNFIDQSVEAETKYEYKVVAVFDGQETDGLKITVNTPKTKVTGGNITKELDENGEHFYLVEWQEPKTGKIQVLIGGKEYKIVNASDRNLKIPLDDMKYTILGEPDITLIPLDDDGKTVGEPSKPKPGDGAGGNTVIDGLKDIDFTIDNLIKISVQLIGLVGAFIMLGLAFRVAKKLIKTVSKSIPNKERVR